MTPQRLLRVPCSTGAKRDWMQAYCDVRHSVARLLARQATLCRLAVRLAIAPFIDQRRRNVSRIDLGAG